MAYIGNPPAEAYTNTVKDSFNGDGSTVAFTMSQPSVTNDVRVVVENVIQDPTVAYSCSGTTLTFTSAPPSGTNNIYVVHLGPAVMTTVPPSDIADATSFLSSVTVQGAFTSQGIDDNATSTAITIDSSERLKFGTTSNTPASAGVAGIVFGDNTAGTPKVGVASFSSDGAAPVLLTRLNSDGNILGLAKDGTTVGSIGTKNNALYIGSTTGSDSYFGFYSNQIIPTTSDGSDKDAVTDLGYSGSRFKDLYLSGGVYLGGTGSANKLDDYEEGTFAPTFTPDTSGSLPLQNAYDTMQYVKIGNWVTLSGFIRTTTPSSPVGSSPNLGNFPFTVANLSDAAGRSSGSVSYFDDSAGNWSVLPVYIVESQTQAYLKIDSSTIGNNDGFYISLNYRTT